MSERIVVVNGERIAPGVAAIDPTDPAFTLGWAVFETMEMWTEAPEGHLAPHLDRLSVSCNGASIPMPSRDVVSHELRQAGAGIEGFSRVRITVSASGLRVVVATPLDTTRRYRPLTAVTGPHVDDPFLGGAVKHTSRASWAVAVQRSGADEVLRVDDSGRFTEGTTSAILAVVDGAIYTAPFDGRILESTTTLRLLGWARELGIRVVREGAHATASLDALYVASATRSLARVTELDGTPMPPMDPVGIALQAADQRV